MHEVDSICDRLSRKGAVTARAMSIAAAMFFHADGAPAASPISVAVADFDYIDSSGEPVDQTAKHAALVSAFAQRLRDDLAGRSDYRVIPIDCPKHPCTAAKMPPDDFVDAARRAGAQFVVYGGISK